MHLGCGFFTPERRDLEVPRHLHFVVSDPDASDRVVIANVSTKPCPSGETCVVTRGEHDKVSRDSFLRFDKVRVAETSELRQLLGSGGCQVTTDAPEALLQKLQRAICESKAVRIEAQKILSDQGFCPGQL